MYRHRYRGPKLSSPHSSALSIKLAKKIEKDTGIPCDPSTFLRTYAGYWQKRSGGFLWVMQRTDRAGEIGGYDSATDCASNKYKLSYDPVNGGISAENPDYVDNRLNKYGKE